MADTKIKSPPIRLADTSGPVTATRETVTSREYPFSRAISIFINHRPDTPVDPKLREFLLFVLSVEGQRLVALDGHFLPLSPALLTRERAKLL